MHGLGVYTWKIGDKYIGEAPLHPSHGSCAGVTRACFELHARLRTGPLQVSYGRIHGFGTYTWRTNSKYVGCWKEGKMHGHGVKTDPHGNLFEGEWREGKPIIKDKANQSPDFLAWLNDSVGAVAGPRRNKEYASVSQHDDD